MSSEKPKEVKDAQLTGDTGKLSWLGHKGGLATAESRRLQKEKERKEKEQLKKRNERDALLEQEELYAVSRDGEILPPRIKTPLRLLDEE